MSSSMISCSLWFSSLQITFSSSTSSMVLKSNVSFLPAASSHSLSVSSHQCCCCTSSPSSGPDWEKESMKAKVKFLVTPNFSASCQLSSLVNQASFLHSSD